MKARALAASVALGLGSIVGVPVAAPALSNAGVEVTGTKADAALLGWSKATCRTDRFRVSWGPGYTRYRVVEYRWWTDSLTGTTCRYYSARYVNIYWR